MKTSLVRKGDMAEQPDDFYVTRLEKAPMVEDSTRRTYVTNLRKAVKVSGARNVDDLLHNPDAYIVNIDSKIPNLNSRNSVYIALKSRSKWDV